MGPLAEPPPRHSVYLHPGQLAVAEKPEVVLTILGSCVAVCLWDVRQGAGGMSHFLLPYRHTEGTARFGGVAVTALLSRLLGLGCAQRDLRAKVVGGANVLMAKKPAGSSLGDQNVTLARELLRDAGIPLLAEHVGGRRGRRLLFDTASGSAWVKLL